MRRHHRPGSRVRHPLSFCPPAFFPRLVHGHAGRVPRGHEARFLRQAEAGSGPEFPSARSRCRSREVGEERAVRESHLEPMKRILWLFALLGTLPLYAQQAPEIQLGLKVGNYWVYVGRVAWSDVTAKNYYDGKKIRWKTEILESTTRGGLKAYLVRDSVTDLAWYLPEDKLGMKSLWVVYQNRFYIRGADDDLLRRFHD